MVEVLKYIFLKFAEETEILEKVTQYGSFAPWALLALGLMLCFFGFKTYRPLFSVLIFMGVAILSCLILKDRTHWGAVVTCFSIVGVFVGFLSFYWHHPAACILCAVIGASVGWAIAPTLWLAIPLGVLGFLSALTFPVLSVCFWTALEGAWILAGAVSLAGIPLPGALVAVVGFLGGLLLQHFTNRRQDTFKKVRPDKVTHWMEKRGLL